MSSMQPLGAGPHSHCHPHSEHSASRRHHRIQFRRSGICRHPGQLQEYLSAGHDGADITIQIYELRNILGSNLAESLDDTNDPSSTSSSLLSLPLNVLTAVVIGVVATGSLALVMLTYFVRREFG